MPNTRFSKPVCSILGSIVVSIPACHAGDRGSIPRRGGEALLSSTMTQATLGAAISLISMEQVYMPG